MTENDWNSVIDPAIELILQRARESIKGDATRDKIQQKIEEFQQEAGRGAQGDRIGVKEALLAYAKLPRK